MFEMEIGNSSNEKTGEKSSEKKVQKTNDENERLGVLKKIVESFSDLVEQMEIKCTDLGISIQVMDPMHAAMSNVFLSKDFFKNYRCDRDVQLGISLKNFVIILKGINLDENSVLKFSCEDNPESLKIQYTMSNSYYEFDITLFKICSENFIVPDISYSTLIKLPSDHFRSITRSIGAFGDFISFQCQKDHVMLSQDSDMLKNRMTLKPDEENVIFECSDPVCAEVAMKYVNLANKLSTLSPNLTIYLSENAPVFFDINLYSLGFVKFYIAPKANK
jgi:proliferating cell nuclear antigen